MLVEKGRIPFHAELVSAENVGHIILIQEFVHHTRPERVARSSNSLSVIQELGEDADAPHLGEIAKSSFSGSGSDQTKSAMGPSCGISAGKIRLRRYNVKIMSGTSKSVDDLNLIN